MEFIHFYTFIRILQITICKISFSNFIRFNLSYRPREMLPTEHQNQKIVKVDGVLILKE